MHLKLGELSIISQFLDFIHCMVFAFIFYSVTMNTLYIDKYTNGNQKATGSGYFTFDKQLGVSLADPPSQTVFFKRTLL